MAIHEDYNANDVNLVPCVREDAMKEIYNKNGLVIEEQIRMTKEYEFQRESVNLLLTGADCGYYGAMKSQMQKNLATGKNSYPKSVDETINILNIFVKMIKN